MSLRRLALIGLSFLGLAVSALAADSAVRWRPWDEANLAEARKAGKPVYVFVANDLSELSRTTEKEVFGRAETAAWLNENFTCIRVDADLQPAVAAYAQHFINTARQLKGWPVHFWLTPELQPYDGANYLPPTEEWGRPGFLKSARTALDAWTQDPSRARALAEEAIAQMSAPPPAASAPIDVEERLAKATAAWVAAADLKNGGFGTAPKHPEPELIRFLLTRGPEAKLVAIAAARAIVNGGLRDPQDGGFFRRTIDAEWKEPYRQKLLVDQARIALALFEVADVAEDEPLRAAADGALRSALTRWVNASLDLKLSEDIGDQGVKGPPVYVDGWMMAALLASSDERWKKAGGGLADVWSERWAKAEIIRHAYKSTEAPTAGDLLALVVGMRAAGRTELADRLVRNAVERYFDPATGRFMASPAQLPVGITVRAPALSEPVSVEALALLAGVKGEAATRIRAGLLAQIEYDDLPSGAVLLALATAED